LQVKLIPVLWLFVVDVQEENKEGVKKNENSFTDSARRCRYLYVERGIYFVDFGKNC